MSKVLIISPSGNFYGSEQVLCDFLKNCSVKADVAIPNNSIFLQKLSAMQLQHVLLPYDNKNPAKFYAILFLKLLFNQYNSIYLNEAGHSKYILLLAKIFRKKKFLIHVRMAEDTAKNRWPYLHGSNVTVIAISSYIQHCLPFQSTLLYDPYNFNTKETTGRETKYGQQKLVVGVIGRITLTKGLSKLIELLQHIHDSDLSDRYQFLLFGDVSEDAKLSGLPEKLRLFANVSLEGFINEQESIYNRIDCIMHFSTQEALGRIFLEAIDYGKLLIGMDAAGIGEIGHLLDLQGLLVNPSSANLISLLKDNLEYVRCDYDKWSKKVLQQKQKAGEIFSVVNYVNSVEKFIV